MTPEEIQKIYEEWPDNDPLLPFDDFLAGGAMSPQTVPDRGMFNRQISGVKTFKDLVEPQDPEPEIPTRNDLMQFAQTAVELLTEEQYTQLFFASKKAAFKTFNFLSIKSSFKGDVPLSESDLILEEEDFYILEFLRGSTKDYFRVQQIATLMAYREMGIEVVRFQKRDSCPLCKSHDGLFYNVTYLLDLLGSGSDLTHPSCDIGWFPVIYRESYAGPLKGEFTMDLEEVMDEDCRMLRNVPVEMYDEILEAASQMPFKIFDFVNMAEYGLNDIDDLEDSTGVVVYCSRDRLVVHNSYVGMRGPAQFIQEYLTAQIVPERIEVGEELEERFFVRGRAAVKRSGSFWDAATGERLC
jgi:hypothetical protein